MHISYGQVLSRPPVAEVMSMLSPPYMYLQSKDANNKIKDQNILMLRQSFNITNDFLLKQFLGSVLNCLSLELGTTLAIGKYSTNVNSKHYYS